MTETQPIPVTDRFSLVLDGLCRAVAARISGGRMTAAMILLVWGRVRRIERLVLALIAAIRAGRVRAIRVRTSRAAGERVVVVDAQRASPVLLPRGFAWLVKLVPYEAAGFGSQLRHLLGDPEMVELLSASPRLGTLLRPLCRMLGLEAGLVMPAVAVPLVAVAALAAPVAPEALAVPDRRVDLGGIVDFRAAVIGGGDAVAGGWGFRVFDGD